MKIEQVIALHLFNHKEVTLQGIGTFRLNSSISLPSEIEKDIVIPENAVFFEYNPKATEDASLIDSIVKHTTKIKPLASADLDSFLMLGRQFLNIGKPFTLDKVGTLDKAQTGELVFVPGQFITPKIEPPKALKENENEESSGLFNDYQREPENDNRKAFVIIAVLLIVGLSAWAIYHFGFAKKTAAVPETLPAQSSLLVDSSAVRRDSNLVSVPADSNSLPKRTLNQSPFRIIIKKTGNLASALKSMNRLKSFGHNVAIETPDSINYKVVQVFERPLTDTAAVKDSLVKIFGRGLSIELK